MHPAMIRLASPPARLVISTPASGSIMGTATSAANAAVTSVRRDGETVFTADSEANIIRAIDLNKGQVRTLAGGDLFDFGDKDGHGDEVRLQHPLGIIALGDKLLIADTYNHKIKELDPRTRNVKTFLGSGKPGQADGSAASFYEPGGLSAANGKLYVADTNNHAVRVVDLKTKQTSTLHIKGLEPPPEVATTPGTNDNGPNAEESTLASQRIRADHEGVLTVNVDLPAGYHLNPAAPQRYRVSIESGLKQLGLKSDSRSGVIWRDHEAKSSAKNLKLPLRVPFRSFESGAAELRVQLTLVYCREDNTGTCRIKTLVWSAPVEVTTDPNAASDLQIEGKILAE